MTSLGTEIVGKWAMELSEHVVDFEKRSAIKSQALVAMLGFDSRANVVMVKKKNGKWRMCTNFTDLNKCYPKDNFRLSRIDKIVDSATSCETMALLDCFPS
jgi:hypothetical protein